MKVLYFFDRLSRDPHRRKTLPEDSTGTMAIFKRVKITEETVEKEESGSLIPPRASFF